MVAQHIFYILGSVFFGLFALIFLMVIGLLSYINRVINKIERISSEIGDEILDAIHKTKAYAKYMGGGYGIASAIGKAFNVHYKWKKSRKNSKTEEEEGDDEK
jgi:ABC-type transport system involved in multi-copper enzyme maturation permease subunit